VVAARIAAVLALLVIPSPALAQTTSSTTSTTQASCAYPRQLVNMGRLADARTEYLSLLSKNPTSAQCALEGLAELDQDPCRVADALKEQGQKDEAKKAYIEILKQDPDSACAKKHLHGATRRSRVWSWVSSAPKGFGTVLGAVGTLLGLLLVLLWVVLQTTRNHRIARRLRRRLPIIRRILRHRFKFAAFDDSALGKDEKLAVPLSMMVQAEVLRASASTMEAPGGESSLGPALDSLKELGPEFKIAAALVALAEKTLPVQHFNIGGAMTSGRRGAGLVLSVERVQDPPAGGQLWQLLPSDPAPGAAPEADDFRELVPQAAGWITCKLGQALAPRQWVVATDAESYGLARAGVVFKDEADLVRARRYLLRALELDAENVTALANLALVDAAEDRSAEAVRLLERAMRILERKLA
jgi:tetratricopeptide (TPR) repeat protein